MCASYMVKRRHPGQLSFIAEARIQSEIYDDIIAPYRLGPVAVAESERFILKEMKFSLVPSWSKDPRVKFATHNARLESIDEKPTWKTVFVRRHCVVPISEFYEPIYDGEYAGHMVAFARRDGELLLAAGVWDEWVNRQTGEVVQSFAVITHDPPPFIAGVGHDRCPVFLNDADAQAWIRRIGEPPGALKQFLLEHRQAPDFDVHKRRAMKPGWEKRK